MTHKELLDNKMIHNIIQNLLKNIENPILFEIGCRQAEDTVVFAQNFPNARILCFEPLASNAEKASENIKNYNNIVLFECALCDKIGNADFWVSSDSADFNGSSSLKEPKEHLDMFSHVKFNEKIKVATFTLDYIVKQQDVDHIDFIWSDTQAGEKEVILGGQDILKKTKYFYGEFYNNEVYEGQTGGYKDWAKHLPGNWSVLQEFPNEVLMVNLDY